MKSEATMDAFSEARCPICALLRRNEFDLLCGWVGMSGEKHKKTGERDRLLQAKGFCNYHFWEFGRMSTRQGSAGVCMGFIEELIEVFRQGGKRDRLQRLSEYHRGLQCPLCADLAVQEAAHIKEIATLLELPENRKKYAEGWGLCIPHFIQTAAGVKDGSLISFLMDTQDKQLERIRTAAAGLISKTDGPLRWEQTADEKNSPVRAIEKLTGRRGLTHGR